MLKKITHKREKDNVIILLKVDNDLKFRKEVYDDLNKNEYYTYPDGLNGKQGARVHKVGDFISTNPNETKRDNLDNLPDF